MMIDSVCATTSCMSRAMRARSAVAAMTRSSPSRATIAALRSRIMRMVASRARCQNANMNAESRQTPMAVNVISRYWPSVSAQSPVSPPPAYTTSQSAYGANVKDFRNTLLVPCIAGQAGPTVIVHPITAVDAKPNPHDSSMNALVLRGSPYAITEYTMRGAQKSETMTAGPKSSCNAATAANANAPTRGALRRIASGTASRTVHVVNAHDGWSNSNPGLKVMLELAPCDANDRNTARTISRMMTWPRSQSASRRNSCLMSFHAIKGWGERTIMPENDFRNIAA